MATALTVDAGEPVFSDGADLRHHPGPGRRMRDSQTIIMGAGCRAEVDGEVGGGQFETHWPVRNVQQLAAARRA